ncbi:cobaltochelatase CobT-related protein [Burkholderia stabilis]|uniref:cobaltochelatase CobT-related protein n=1 Tax=Burkholderia stabilis TaxID=95485 RepID=UPI0009F342A3|nr:VWA domain-containing protein [Burkholderia stabilis]
MCCKLVEIATRHCTYRLPQPLPGPTPRRGQPAVRRPARFPGCAQHASPKRFFREVRTGIARADKRCDSDNPGGLACIECGHENPDGEALSWAAERLLATRERRRILMVLSDGYPATGDGNPAILRTDLRARVDALRAQRVELIGVGILDDSVESFYPVSSVVDHLQALPGAAFSVLSDTLLDRR